MGALDLLDVLENGGHTSEPRVRRWRVIAHELRSLSEWSMGEGSREVKKEATEKIFHKNVFCPEIFF